MLATLMSVQNLSRRPVFVKYGVSWFCVNVPIDRFDYGTRVSLFFDLSFKDFNVYKKHL